MEADAHLGDPVIHDHPKCGKPALHLRPGYVPNRTDIVRCRDFLHTDGRRIEEGERMICDSCRGPFSGFGANFDETTWRVY